jgi:hypothetical protein
MQATAKAFPRGGKLGARHVAQHIRIRQAGRFQDQRLNGVSRPIPGKG